MILVSSNPFAVEPAMLREIEVLATWKEGKLVWGSADSPPGDS
jgi:predicted amidohydrolase YtcJ